MSVNNKQYFNYLYFFLTLGLTLLLLILTLRVKTIECYQAGTDQDELASVCEQLNEYFSGKSLIFYDFFAANIWQELALSVDYQQLYQLSSLEKKAPTRLILYLDSKLPDYRLIVMTEDKQEQSYILNQNNNLKKDHGQESLFEIYYRGQNEILSKNQHYLEEEYHQFFLAIKNNLEKYQINAKSLIWQNDGLIELDLGKSWLIILDKDIKPEEMMQKISIILLDEAVIAEIERQGFLDMRFNLPVIREQI
jgi:hypothetical protein